MSEQQNDITVSREIREEQKKALQNMTLKGKLSYFWDYYKIHTIAFIFICILTFTLIRDVVTSKDSIFMCMMLNSYQLNGEELSADFADYAGLDIENYDITFDTLSSLSLASTSESDIGTTQKIMALMQTQELDVIVSNQEVFLNYADNEMFLDLRSVLMDEELEKYADYFFYIDAALIGKQYEETLTLDEAMNKTSDAITLEAQGRKDPSTMQQPVPVGIYVSQSPFISETECYLGMESVFGIPSTSVRTETSKEFLSYLFSGRVPEFSDPYFGSSEK